MGVAFLVAMTKHLKRSSAQECPGTVTNIMARSNLGKESVLFRLRLSVLSSLTEVRVETQAWQELEALWRKMLAECFLVCLVTCVYLSFLLKYHQRSFA